MVAWTTFQDEFMDKLTTHPCGHGLPPITMRTISLLGLLHSVGQASDDHLDSAILGKPNNRDRHIYIAGQLYYYLLHYYATYKDMGKSKLSPCVGDKSQILTIIWKLHNKICALQKLTNVCMTEEDTHNAIITLKEVENLIHTMVSAYCVSLTEVRSRLLFELDSKFEPDICFNVEEMKFMNLCIDEYFILLGLYKYSTEKAGALFLPNLKELKPFMPEVYLRSRRLDIAVAKLLRFRFLAKKDKKYYITEKAKKFLRMQKSI